MKQTPKAKSKFEYRINVNPTGVGDTLPIGEYAVSDIPWSSFEKPTDIVSGAYVEGEWEIVGQGDKIFIPMFYNTLMFRIVFIPEDKSKYNSVESKLVVYLDGVERKLFFSGTRGKWFL